MEIEVTSGAIATLIAESARTAPLECCGLLLGRDGRIELARAADNVADDPSRRFEIDPAALLAAHRGARNGGPELLGYFHSHPNGHPLPSATDCEHSSGDNRVWAIVANGEVRFFRDSPQEGFAPVSYRVV